MNLPTSLNDIFDISDAVQHTMHNLEALDAQDRKDGTPHSQRLRQIPPQSGILLALLADSAPQGRFVEIGTSAGYSALWISLAAKKRSQSLITLEIDPQKIARAAETFRQAEVSSLIEQSAGDAKETLAKIDNIAFCFLDSDKELYEDIYSVVIPRLIPGAIFVADNVISHQAELQTFVNRARNDKALNAAVIPVGKGLLFGRKLEI